MIFIKILFLLSALISLVLFMASGYTIINEFPVSQWTEIEYFIMGFNFLMLAAFLNAFQSK